MAARKSAAKVGKKTAENDRILRSLGLKHLLFDTLSRRETQIFNELMPLRGAILGKNFIRVTDHSGFSASRKIIQSTETRKVSIQYSPAASSFATTIDLTGEYAARRRERMLAAELAKIDALWGERYAALKRGTKSNGRTAH